MSRNGDRSRRDNKNQKDRSSMDDRGIVHTSNRGYVVYHAGEMNEDLLKYPFPSGRSGLYKPFVFPGRGCRKVHR